LKGDGVDAIEGEARTESFGKGAQQSQIDEGDVPTISRDELKQKIDRKDNFFLVETLAPNYYNHAHLPGAINLPPDQVRELAPRLLPNQAAEIVVYCGKLT
jgi:3-mercaptopyruvate sulfurtransferase SseA